MKVFGLFLGLLLSSPACAQFIHDTSGYSKIIYIQQGEERLDAYRFFFKGEAHEFPAANARSLFALLKYLHVKSNVRYLIVEFGPDVEWLANKFLETGNDSLLSRFKYIEIDFWKNLRELNKNLSTDKRIKVAGFDFNRPVFTRAAFGAMVNGKPPFPRQEIQMLLQKIINWDDRPWDMYEKSAVSKQMVADMNQLKRYHAQYAEIFKSYFGIDYLAFSRIINNTADITPTVKRDKEVLKVLENRSHEFSNGAFLFNYGIAHVFLDGVGLAKMLSGKKEYTGRICSIYPFYKGDDLIKSKTLIKIEENLPSAFRSEIDSLQGHTLISLEEKGIYPRQFRKSQWVLVIGL